MTEETKQEVHHKNNFKSFFKDKLNIIIFIIILFGILIRIYYLFIAANQPLWWDESEMLLQAKHIAFNTPNTGWFPYREPLLPIIFGFFLKLGATEFFIRFIQILFSITGLIFTYLAGKEIFDKKIALIATAFMSYFYLHIFYSIRILSEAATLTFVTLAVYLFWKGYVKEVSTKYLVLLAIISAIGFAIYYAVGFIFLVFLVFLLLTDKFKFLKNKKIWISLAILTILLIPYVIFSYSTVNAPFPRLGQIAGMNNPSTPSAWLAYFKLFPMYLQLVLLLLFLLGVIYLLVNLVLGFDLLIKGHNQELKKDLFIVLWIIIPIFLFTYVAVNGGEGHIEDRYLMMIFPAVFLTASKILVKLGDYLKKYDFKLEIALIILVILLVGIQQIMQTESLVKSKLSSYEQVKDAGLWIKANSQPSDVVISNSIPQNTYYSERATYYDEDIGKAVQQYKPKYVVWSVFEASGQDPNSKFTKYLQENQSYFKVVNAYFADKEQKQPLLVIFEPKP
jgi:4-amino-4-deoxy-L-arabinose transferase-like glycosyltransferase